MKSYTDISQSKKLAEIIPLESADMEYLAIKENGELVGVVPFVKDYSEVEDSAYNHTYDRIACWSLAALLGVLPKDIIDNDKKYFINIAEGLTGNWLITYDSGVNENDYILPTGCENLVDACVAMIEKLNELNLL